MTNSRSIISRDGLARLLAALAWAGGAALLVYAWVSGGYLVTVLGFALIYAIFVTGLNVFMGFAGQVSFGQNAFAAISGYASAVLTTTYALDPIAALVIGVGLALACALLIGYPTLRLKGHYLAMATLAVGLIVYEIAVQWQSVTQGYMGISGIPPLGIGRYQVTSERGQLVVLAATAALLIFVSARIRHSRLGRAFAAVAGSEDAARALGIAVARYKLIAFLIAAAYAALAGSLFVHVVGFVSPEVFGLHMVVLAFTMLYVGGIGTIAGPLIGAVAISLLPEVFRQFKDYQDLAYGAALIVLLIYAPRGISSLGDLVVRHPGTRGQP
jgi:branched-chain amino acid transport system permease protein